MDRVQFIGVNELPVGEQSDVRGVVGEFVNKFNKMTPTFEQLIVHLKQYGKGGKPKYSFHLHFKAPGHSKDAAADDFILTRALHAAFEALEKQFERKMGRNSGGWI